jgi:signal transduction histidine kinase/GAF domain-containing protein
VSNRVLVVMGTAPDSLLEQVRAKGLEPQVCSAVVASQQVAEGQSRLLLCGGTAAWMPLVIRADRMGAFSVVLGDSAQERQSLLPEGVRFAPTVDDAVDALAGWAQQLATKPETSSEPEGSAVFLERLRRAELVGKAAQTIAAQMDLPNVLQEAMARARELCEAQAASLLLVDAQTGELCFDVVSGGAGGGLEQLRLKPGEGIAGQVAATARSHLVENVQEHASFSGRVDGLTGFATGSVIAVPLLWGGDVLGVLEAIRTSDRPAFQTMQLRRLEDLAPHIAVAVHNAQMTEALRASQEQVLKDNAALETKVVERTAQLARAKVEWEQTFDAISEPIGLQEGFKLLRTNQAYAQAAGVAVREVPGKTCHALLAGRDSPCPGCPLVSGKTGPVAEHRMKNGMLYRISAFRLQSGGQQRTVVQYQDITQQRRLEALLRESERMASVGQLASGAAHEINNPLGFLIANLANLEETVGELKSALEMTTEAQRKLQTGDAQGATRALLRWEEAAIPEKLHDATEMLSESRTGAERMGAVVRALRELSRLEVSRPEPTHLQASLERILTQETAGAQVTLEVGDERLMVTAPALQLDQVLRQVLKNAKQAVTGTGGIHITVHSTASHVQLEVKDQGVGIAPEHLHRVFEPFFTTRGVGQGMGLGLTAAYGIVKRYGGNIELSSELGQGTTVTLTLPRSL